MTAIRLRGVRKAYGPVLAVDGADLDVAGGEITALLGPSGCGKTTLLRLIAGFETPDAGTIELGGRAVAGGSGPGGFVPPERRRVGMVFQHLALFPHLDVAANVGYGLRGVDARRRAERTGELLALVGLPGLERRMPHELSGGQAQRVALARALAPGPGVVLFDEPFSSLDVALRAGLRAEVRRILRAAGVTALLVTHDQGEALSLGDRVAVMFGGRIHQAGPPEQVYRHPATPAVAAFLGDANEVAGTVSAGTVVTELGSVTTSLPDGPAVVVVRAEDLEVVREPAGPASVEDVDYFGHDQLLAVRLPSGARVKARLHAAQRLEPGSAVSVRLRAGAGEAAAVFPA